MHVFVAGWHPSVSGGSTGGFEWRYSRYEALKVMLHLVADQIALDGRHNLVFAHVEVPFEVNPDRPRTYDDRESAITRWLDENLDLIELPLQKV